MINKLLKEIKLIINFGIDENENLSKEERISRMQIFKKELSVEKYNALFINIEDALLKDNITLNEKDMLISKFLDLFSYYTVLQENYYKLPLILQQLYKSHSFYKRLCVLFEAIDNKEFAMTFDFEKIMLDYFDFLDNPENEFYIYNCYSKIEKINKMVNNFLNKKDFNDKKFEDVINKPELIFIFKEKSKQYCLKIN